MLDSTLFKIVVGAILGLLSGLGVGGGSLLILWLTLIMQVPQEVARNINLLFFLPTALIASLFRWKKGNLNFKKILPAMLGGVIVEMDGKRMDGSVKRRLQVLKDVMSE